MANQLVTKIAEKVWVETQMGRLEDWLPFAEYAVNEVIAAQQSVQPTLATSCENKHNKYIQYGCVFCPDCDKSLGG